MNKQEYMRQLKEKLKRLPKEDFMHAVDYYEEYFADAGPENEQKAIEDLGNPQEAAEQIIRDMALHYSEEPIKDVRRGMNALWVAVLALCAAPIALPLLFAGIILLGSVVIVIGALLVSFILVAACMVIVGPLTVLAGFTVLPKSMAVFLTCTGMGLFSIGSGAAFTALGCRLFRRFLAWTLRLFAGMIRKGGRKHAES